MLAFFKEELKEKAKIEDEKKDEEKEDPKGIPEFWLTVFKNVDLLSDMVQEHDEPILKHLKDIKVKFSDAGQPMVKEVLNIYSFVVLCTDKFKSSVGVWD